MPVLHTLSEKDELGETEGEPEAVKLELGEYELLIVGHCEAVLVALEVGLMLMELLPLRMAEAEEEAVPRKPSAAAPMLGETEGEPDADTLALEEWELLVVEHGDGVRVRHWLAVKLSLPLAQAVLEGKIERVPEGDTLNDTEVRALKEIEDVEDAEGELLAETLAQADW